MARGDVFLPIYQANLASIGVKLNIVDQSPALFDATQTRSSSTITRA